MTMQLPGRGDGDHIIYYRRPLKARNGMPLVHAGWITWGDSLSGTKHRDMTVRGFEPLHQYTRINTQSRDKRMYEPGDEAAISRSRYIWESILSHPDGPAEFPVEQIVTYRWYRPEECPVEGVTFPQLVGMKLRELTCPERCGRLPFVELEGTGGVTALRKHLRIMHGWDQANLMAYGERVGIDFNKADVEAMNIEQMTYEAPKRRAKAEPLVPVEVV